MQFALLIYGAEADNPDQMGEDDRAAFYERFGRFNRSVEEAGAFVTARRLEPIAEAATIRSGPEEDVLVTDGPFAETKECLAGFYVVECETREEALAWARQMPSIDIGCVEVRPIRRY